MNNTMKGLTGWTCLLVGFSLLVVTVLGAATRLGDYRSAEPRDWEVFDPELVAQTPGIDELVQLANASLTHSLTHEMRS